MEAMGQVAEKSLSTRNDLISVLDSMSKLAFAGKKDSREWSTLYYKLWDCVDANPKLISDNYNIVRGYFLGDLDTFGHFLVKVAATAPNSKMNSDIENEILAKPKRFESLLQSFEDALLNSGKSKLRELWINKLIENAKSEKLGDKKEPGPFGNALSKALGKDEGKLEECFKSGNVTLGIVSIAAMFTADDFDKVLKNPKFHELADFALEKAIEGDSYYYQLSSYCFMLTSPHPDQFKQFLDLSRTDEGGLFPLAAAFQFFWYDRKFYLGAFDEINSRYEKADLNCISKLAGVMIALWPMYLHAAGEFMQQGNLEKLKMATGILFSSGIAHELFGTPGAMLGMVKGEIPSGRILKMLLKDDRHRKFAFGAISDSFTLGEMIMGNFGAVYEEEDPYQTMRKNYKEEVAKLGKGDFRKLVGIIELEKKEDDPRTQRAVEVLDSLMHEK